MKKGLGPERRRVPRGPYPSSSSGVVGYHFSVEGSKRGDIWSDDPAIVRWTEAFGEVSASTETAATARISKVCKYMLGFRVQ